MRKKENENYDVVKKTNARETTERPVIDVDETTKNASNVTGCGCRAQSRQTEERTCECEENGVFEGKEDLLNKYGRSDLLEKVTEEELQEIYRNACLGKESVEILRPLSEDRRFRNLLLHQYKEYAKITKEIEIFAGENGIDIKGSSFFARSMMYMTTNINTLSDRSNSKLSEIMIQGINMGIISTTKVVNKLHDDGRECPLASELLKLLDKNLAEMKVFL